MVLKKIFSNGRHIAGIKLKRTDFYPILKSQIYLNNEKTYNFLSIRVEMQFYGYATFRLF